MAAAFSRLGIQGASSELLLQFSAQVAGDDGVMDISDMCVTCDARLSPPVFTPFLRRRAVDIDCHGEEGAGWGSSQRALLMTRLRAEGRNLKDFWGDAVGWSGGSGGGGVSAGQLQAYIDTLAGKQNTEGKTGKGVVLEYFCQDDSVLTFDDVYDALVCL
jgi:CubicO group peptidase (beta-lactamase class C family)